jgi:hypothetical protein
MPKALDAAKIAETNPKVDLAEVRRAEELLKELRKQGVSKSEYDVVSPYDRRPLDKPDEPPPRLSR